MKEKLPIKHFYKNPIYIFLISIMLIAGYLIALYYLKKYFLNNNDKSGFRLSEYADYIGGILNPLFTLLSTFSIILLTYIISINENNKVDETIITQKRITLNEMRHETLKALTEKLNLFIYQLDKVPIYNVREGSFTQKVITSKLERDEEKKLNEKVSTLLIISYELENFRQLNYLFLNLFNDEEFLSVYNSLMKLMTQLITQQSSIKMITTNNLESYIELQNELVNKIGNYIISEF
ncbi:hypothetical protein [Flavobacterium sp.]|uniref:hypothetical protein n=1 Tax=Flavobacterium sp. TaxID=239 RepID=UPI002EDB476B